MDWSRRWKYQGCRSRKRSDGRQKSDGRICHIAWRCTSSPWVVRTYFQRQDVFCRASCHRGSEFFDFFEKIQGFISFSIIPFLNQFASYPRSANRTLVRGKDLGAWQGMQNGPRAQKIAALPFREPQDERTAFCIANGVERWVQAACAPWDVSPPSWFVIIFRLNIII